MLNPNQQTKLRLLGPWLYRKAFKRALQGYGHNEVGNPVVGKKEKRGRES